jgi:hypothetical protein
MGMEMTPVAIDPIRLFFDAGGPAAVGALGWWLSGKFRKADDNARVIAETVAVRAQQAIDRHEKIDQDRHVENLSNFHEANDTFKEVNETLQAIEVRLARAGINGNAEH